LCRAYRRTTESPTTVTIEAATRAEDFALSSIGRGCEAMRKILFASTLLAVCCFAASRVNAQATYEYSVISYDDSSNTVNGYSATEVDYYVSVDYQAYVEGYLYDDSSAQLLDYGSATDSLIAEVYTAASVNPGDQYHVDSYHDVLATYYYETIEKEPDGCWPCDGCNTDCYYFYDDYYWYDPFGFSFASTGYYGPWWSIYGFGPPNQIEYQQEEPLGETSDYVSTDPNRKIISFTQHIIDESTQGQEVVECGRFTITVRYLVGCPPPNNTLELIGHIQDDAILLGSDTTLINNDHDEICTYDYVASYKMKNRLSQTIGTGFTSYTARLTWDGKSVTKAGPGISTRATIPGTGACP
jgi:hypothetical protein